MGWTCIDNTLRIKYMGYTHYWSYDPNKIENTEELRCKFRKAVSEIRKAASILRKFPFYHKDNAGGFYNDIPCILKGGLGEGTPMINESQIWFNGDSSTKHNHETFSIQWYQNNSSRNFCKTARKPYDLLVCFALLALHDAFDNSQVFNFSSDGNAEDWKPALEFYEVVTKKESKLDIDKVLGS